MVSLVFFLFFFFFNDTATTEIYTLSLHDALPISWWRHPPSPPTSPRSGWSMPTGRSEEHTSELQSHHDLVCRLLLEKKKKHSRTAGACRRLRSGSVRSGCRARRSSRSAVRSLFFFFNDTATTEIYTLSLHDALPIFNHGSLYMVVGQLAKAGYITEV